MTCNWYQTVIVIYTTLKTANSIIMQTKAQILDSASVLRPHDDGEHDMSIKQWSSRGNIDWDMPIRLALLEKH